MMSCVVNGSKKIKTKILANILNSKTGIKIRKKILAVLC